jgi:hypothetical protein
MIHLILSQDELDALYTCIHRVRVQECLLGSTQDVDLNDPITADAHDAYHHAAIALTALQRTGPSAPVKPTPPARVIVKESLFR